MLTDSERQFLLKIARQSIESATTGSPSPTTDDCPSSLKERCGAFVTLREGGDLRGCIGYVEAILPLAETIADVAAKAAAEDPRFLPVSRDELPRIEIEISVISPMNPIRNVDEIEIGKHGLMLVFGNKRGLLLPQVPIELSWDKETFLEQTSRKAGLPKDTWQHSSAKLFTFTAEIFSEHSTTLVKP